MRKKWGGEEGLDKEFERREAEKAKREEKAFKQKMAGVHLRPHQNINA